jgi:hypothetical protein
MPDSTKVALALDELKALRQRVDVVSELVAGDPRLAVELARLRLSAALMQRWTENRLAELELEAVPV